MRYKSPATLALSVALLTAVSVPVAFAQGKPIDPDADRLLRASSKYLADARNFCVKVEVWKDAVLPDGQKLQTTRTLEVQQARPNRLHIEVRSPRASRGFWLRDKSLTMLDRTMNLYGVMDVPDKIDDAIDSVEERFGFEIPLGDVLVSDPYANLATNVESATDLGKVSVLGTDCNHLALTGPNADVQLWIADGPKPLPRKIVITFKNRAGSPSITQIFSDWDLVSPIADSVFTFVAPAGAGKITVNPKQAEVEDSAAEESAPAFKPESKASAK